MAVYNKTVPATALFPLAQVAARACEVGTEFAAGTKMAAEIFCHFGRDNTGTPTGGARIRIEIAGAATGNRAWFPIHQWQSGTVAAATQTITAGGHTHPSKVTTVGSATGIAAGDACLVKNATLANSEWGRVVKITDTVDVNWEENFANDQDSSVLYDQAHIFPPLPVYLDAGTRIRAVIDFYSQAHTQTAIVEVLMNTLDSIG